MRRNADAKRTAFRIARPACVALVLALSAAGTAARAQDTLLIQPTLPDDFDRGRNVSVTQRERPDYDPLGVRLGSFVALPQVDVALGYSNNLFYSQNNKVSDGFVQVTPAFQLKSDWSRNSLQFRGGTTIERYFSNGLRNQTPWDLDLTGILELGDSFRVIPEAQIKRQFESPFSGETTSSTAVLSSYLRKYGSLRAEYEAGQTRLTVAVDDTNYKFANIEFLGGAIFDQSDRNRNILRGTGQAEYAFTPSVAVYGQFSYSHTDYDRNLLTGDPNRDSNAWRGMGGINFDLAGLMRGSIGVGYAHRAFTSALYRDVGGFSAEGKIEYFPTELTTFTLSVRRVIEDSTLSRNSGFFDNRASVRVDHELLRNLLLDLEGEYARQSYIDLNAVADVYRISGGALLLSSNSLSFNFNLGYTGRTTSNELVLGQPFTEFRGLIGVTFKR